MDNDVVASSRSPRMGELLGLCILISASGGVRWAVPCGAAASLHHWASGDVAPGQGCPDPLVPGGLALRSCTLGCSYKDLSGLISMQDLMDYASAFLKQWVVTTIPIFPYKCLSGWVIDNLDTIFMWSLSFYLPWHWSWTKHQCAKTRQR